ncbi:hypothetical protein, partial [Bradyrhizobium liaoningense]
IFAPDSQQESSPLSGRKSTQATVRICGASSNHKLAGYYFLPKLETDGNETGFVALLREANHLPRKLARLIAGGLDATSEGLSDQSHWLALVDFTHSDFAMPVGEITSPQVEHLLQTFSHLFGRIGLPDPERAKVDAFCAIRPQ